MIFRMTNHSGSALCLGLPIFLVCVSLYAIMYLNFHDLQL